MLPFLCQFTGDKPPAEAAYFVPEKDAGPFKKLVVGSDDKNKKHIVVNTEDKTLSVKVLDDTQSSTHIFVISDAYI